MTSRFRMRVGASALALALMAVALPLAGQALANHPDSCLDVTPETSSGPTGTHTLTATLRSIAGAQAGSGCAQAAVSATNGAVNIDFEITGPNDPDTGNTPATPDKTCAIPNGSSSCTVSLTGGAVGTDTIRGWIDHDNSNTTVEADVSEARCANAQGDEAGCTPATGGAISEPDITDVVERTWTSSLPATRLDCTPETASDQIGTPHTVTCTATNANNQPVAGAQIDAEATGANDPDGSSVLTSPDFTCTTNASGTCTFSHSGATAQGTTTYRAWIDADANNATAEADATEGQDSAATPGATAEPDATDVVTNAWSGGAATLDCDDSTGPNTEHEANPATGSSDPTSRETYTCTVRDAQGRTVSIATTVKGEVMNGVNDPDATDGASLESPDYSCATSAGTCTIVVTQNENETGSGLICFWVGTTSEGQALCASEPTDEGAATNGTDAGNDLADQVEVTWARVTTAVRLDCTPETVSNALNSTDVITCTARDAANAVVAGANIDMEATGANDPGAGNSPATPDFTCTTNASGVCTFTHSGGTAAGVTTYRAWIDVDGSNATVEADAAEGRDEVATPGDVAEPDLTDVMSKSWLGPPAAVAVSPTTDTASVGTCNVFTFTVTDSAQQPVPNVTLDIEQTHQRAQDSTAANEPTVSFCTPTSGANPSSVDTTKGDLVESPDNAGTAGGETTVKTDATGRVTIGITVQPANGSDGTGTATVTGFFETTDNDDANAGEPQAAATKTWITAQGRTITCAPATATHPTGGQHTVTCTVRDRFGEAIGGEGVTFSESGPGDMTSAAQQTTNASGQVTATFTSLQPGAQTITATISDDLSGAEPGEVDDCDRAAGDPAGALAGKCTDSVTHTWTQATPFHVEMTPDESRSRPGQERTLDVFVTDVAGAPIAGIPLALTLDGQGRVDGEPVTDATGHATFTINSDEPGNEAVTVTTASCATGGDCSDTSIHHWGPANCDIFGTNGVDVLVGSADPEVICGFGGRDVLDGNGGGDVLLGGGGTDTMRGGEGDDILRGGDGRDVMHGGSGADVVAGGAGADLVDGDSGNDSLSGGSGRDRINGGPGFDVCSGGPGRDELLNCES